MEKKNLNKSGIYKITNIKTKCFYIGSAVNFNKRKAVHFYHLKNNIHHSKYLQNSYNKHGLEIFIFEVLAYCPKEYLIKLEQWFLDNLKPKYNVCKIAGSPIGVKASKETREKLRLAKLGKKLKPFTEEHKRKIGLSNKGKKMSDEQKLKLSEKLKGKKQSEDTKIKRSNSLKGRKRDFETIEKIKIGNKGKKLSKEQVENLREKKFKIIELTNLTTNEVLICKGYNEAANVIKCHRVTANKCALGKIKSVNGYSLKILK